MSGNIDRILAYHERTKHHPERYARGPGGLDWRNQPNPFRRFIGAPERTLPLSEAASAVPGEALFRPTAGVAQKLALGTISRFFELSLGLSARKEIPGSSWYLRMNPSSGNLHPSEGYALLPELPELEGGAGLYHYAPLEHALEQRARWARGGRWESAGFFVGLSSIVWREAWKYGERAFRYCLHDAGHALAGLRFAAAVLGWRVELVRQVSDQTLARLLGLDREEDFELAEREFPQFLTWVETVKKSAAPGFPAGEAIEWFGRANRLSTHEVEWPAITEAIEASERTEGESSGEPMLGGSATEISAPDTGLTAETIIRSRRSAVDFDGMTSISREAFIRALGTTLVRSETPPFDVFPVCRINLVLFVHRVEGVESGLYLWLRNAEHEALLRAAMRQDFKWVKDPEAPLYLMGKGDLREFAGSVSCGQHIAADGAFSLGMLARFEPVLREEGAGAYRELFWEAGMIGQALYLAAEAAGVRGTGIGCYFDDLMHRALGLSGREWQSLYHFTIGKPIRDKAVSRARPL